MNENIKIHKRRAPGNRNKRPLTLCLIGPREGGQALIVIVLALLGLAGIVGLVVDGGNAFQDRRKAQNAADSAALAAALSRIRGERNFAATALNIAAKNGYNNDGTTNIVQVHSPPISGPNKGNFEYIQVTIVSHVRTYIASVVGWTRLTNTVNAVARTKTPEITQLLNGAAIVSLAPTSNCNKDRSFWVHQEATLDITGGDIFINSNNPTCALIQQGNGSIRIRDGHAISMVGGAQINRRELLTPSLPTKATPMSYPPPFVMPKVGCDKSAEISEDGTTMSPGNWDKKFPPEGVTRLEEGVYCLGAGFHITEDLDGTNVVFYVEKGEVRFDKWAKISLGGPSYGDLKGLLIYLPMENDSVVMLNGGPESEIIGTILAPASRIVIQGNSSPKGFHSQIIGYTIEANGDNNVIIKYTDEENYDALNMPEVQLAE
jgi:Flp pilus assembly protein TadG